MIRFWKKESEKEVPMPVVSADPAVGKCVLEVPEGSDDESTLKAVSSFIESCEFKKNDIVPYTLTTLYSTDLIEARLSACVLVDKLTGYHKEAFRMVTSGCVKTVIYTIFDGKELLSIIGIEKDVEPRTFNRIEGEC